MTRNSLTVAAFVCATAALTSAAFAAAPFPQWYHGAWKCDVGGIKLKFTAGYDQSSSMNCDGSDCDATAIFNERVTGWVYKDKPFPLEVLDRSDTSVTLHVDNLNTDMSLTKAGRNNARGVLATSGDDGAFTCQRNPLPASAPSMQHVGKKPLLAPTDLIVPVGQGDSADESEG